MSHRPDVGVGASFVLSVLVVGVAAVALYPVSEATARKSASATAPAPSSKAKVEPPAVARAPRAVSSPPRRDSALAHAPTTPASRPATTIRTSRRQPDSAFTCAAPGETLADVAARVYGSREASKTLWKANRDRLEAPDVPLVAGMMLRTP
jgi:hypothetical protein